MIRCACRAEHEGIANDIVECPNEGTHKCPSCDLFVCDMCWDGDNGMCDICVQDRDSDE